ncbi:HipA family kinase [Haemophilus paraphrohaemolyticus]|uniref:Toxin-antitoxin system, toxin component, HipA family n=1 Tax=Haemophilus paraphrohaemolyticus HK411 TaxID=1095743 RepID=I2NCT7_9PAST|nr:HipA family kinase [Haemophilus paraphrohaemolyticus]EIG23648.1 toxin-antitoxin system, toxin component, HipA family [Haemophilus paraphrohaemolyticus HK411]OOR93259.1 toxin HipA [Haemophilus paraphrohaemolyticus]
MNKVTLIRERTEMGVTQPFICQTENEQWFVVKTTAMMPIAQLLAEVIGSMLAHEIGLPSPQFCFVDITEKSTQYVSAQWRSALPPGSAFGSAFIRNAKVAKTAQAKNVNYLSEPEQKLLYMFDLWILNSDRTASQIGTGNINLLFDETQQKILVIDHNLAFDETAIFNEHIFSPQNRDWELDWVDKETFTQKAIDTLTKFDHIYQSIPDDWFPLDDEAFQQMETKIRKIQSILNRIKEEHYWDNIK